MKFALYLENIASRLLTYKSDLRLIEILFNLKPSLFNFYVIKHKESIFEIFLQLLTRKI